jgi:hypothetical protein
MTDPAETQGGISSAGGVPASVYGALQASGFPFQTAVEYVIRKTDEWSVLGIESPWRDSDGADQFLDIVAGSGQFLPKRRYSSNEGSPTPPRSQVAGVIVAGKADRLGSTSPS